MVELTTQWDESSIDHTTRRLAEEKAARLERERRQVRDDSRQGLVTRREKGGESVDSSVGGATAPPTKKPKNGAMKAVEKVLEELRQGC